MSKFPLASLIAALTRVTFIILTFHNGNRVLSFTIVPCTDVSCENEETENRNKKKTAKYLMLKIVGLM
jgi:hypothetical protein